MADKNPDLFEDLRQQQEALSRWDNEGGADHGGLHQRVASGGAEPEVPELTNAELVHLRIRVIALENPVISMLAGELIGSLIWLARYRAIFLRDPGLPHTL